jgi:hypothetical protein
MTSTDFPFIVTEDEEVIAGFKRLEDAARFASSQEWQDAHHNVALLKLPARAVDR